jgi:hypothetical protein
MPTNTRKKYHGKTNKTQRKSRAKARVRGASMEQVRQNRMRNKMIRNIRMGRIHQGGGDSGSGGFFSQFIGKPWSAEPGNTGKYFALSPKGVGTGIVPKFDDGRPLGSARFPTQLGPQLPKLGQLGGRRRSRKNIKGGGILDGATYLVNKFNATLGGTSRPPNPSPFVQPSLQSSHL